MAQNKGGMAIELQPIRFKASQSSGEVSGLLQIAPEARWLLVLGHGAGAGMRHRFLEGVCAALAGQGVSTFRYQFPYMESGKRAPDPEPLLLATVRSAVEAARRAAPDLPLLAGGKSLGGRMTSTAAAREALRDVRGLVFLGFPLHAPGRPSLQRAEHLTRVDLPMLFLQGTRDRLADLGLIQEVCQGLAPRATLHVVDSADHSFNLPKKMGRTAEEVHLELARAVGEWFSTLSPASPLG